jgi:UDP-N-acetylglucosamine 1-carboxyvinyltransferase
MAMSTVADGTTVFVENIFENRFQHIPELVRLGAKIKAEGKVAVVEGVKNLSGAFVKAPDLRAGAAIVVAAMAKKGCYSIEGLKFIDRGYERIEDVFSSLGADIRRVSVGSEKTNETE